MIQAVLFDVDGVLVHPGRFRSWLEREHGITPAMTASFFRGPFVDCVEGRADVADVLPPFLDVWGWTGSVAGFIEAWFSVEDTPDLEVLGEVAAIRAAGIPCFVASTQEARRAKYLTEDMGFGRLFDGLFFSSTVGFEKPKEGFFRAIADALGRSGADLLFFDDLPANVAGARAAGWSAELFTDVAALRHEVHRYTGLDLDTGGVAMTGSVQDLTIRPFEAGDRTTLEGLWGRVFADDPPWNAPGAMIENKLRVQPELLLVGVMDGSLVGAVMAGFDGVRGWIHHLAVAPERRRLGIATQLVRAAEAGLRRLGCPKVNIQIRASNAGVIAFYEKLGFTIEERVSMGRRLTDTVTRNMTMDGVRDDH